MRLAQAREKNEKRRGGERERNGATFFKIFEPRQVRCASVSLAFSPCRASSPLALGPHGPPEVSRVVLDGRVELEGPERRQREGDV